MPWPTRGCSAGRPPDTPAAVIEWGSYPFQRTVAGPLCEIAGRVEREGLGAPAVVVVGAVVALREPLSWFERRGSPRGPLMARELRRPDDRWTRAREFDGVGSR